MARNYPYDITPDALYHPAAGKMPEDFFVDWSAAEKAHVDMSCAELSRLAYGEESLVRFALPRAGMKLVAWIGGEGLPERFNTWGTDGFVAVRGDGTTFVVFRGTEPGKAEDLIADLRIKPAHWWQGGLVHEGFNAAYHSVQDTLNKVLKQYPGKLVFTGHSLGAAVATLAAADHREREPELITFGSPRVGDDEFLAQIAKGVKPSRYVNCCDVVTRIPPEVIDKAHLDDLLSCFLWSTVGAEALEALTADLVDELAGHPVFKHFGNTIYIDQTGKVQGVLDEPTIKGDQDGARHAYPPKRPLEAISAPQGRLAEGVLAFIKDQLGTNRVPYRDLADHAPLNYVRAFPAKPDSGNLG